MAPILFRQGIAWKGQVFSVWMTWVQILALPITIWVMICSYFTSVNHNFSVHNFPFNNYLSRFCQEKWAALCLSSGQCAQRVPFLFSPLDCLPCFCLRYTCLNCMWQPSSTGLKRRSALAQMSEKSRGRTGYRLNLIWKLKHHDQDPGLFSQLI